jgi:hypothetical protein
MRTTSPAVKMTMGQFMQEHKRLVGVLRHPTRAKLKAEAGKQSKEVDEKQK